MRALVCVVAGCCAFAAATVCWAQEQPLGVISPEAQEAIRLLGAKDVYERQMGFVRLEALREPATAPVIRQHLASRSADTRAFSVRALAAVEGTAAIPTLLERLQHDKHPKVRVAAILALEPIQDATVMPVLIGKLRDRNPTVRMAAADVVSRINQPEARQAIQRRWRRERDRDVRRVLEQAMTRLGAPLKR
jgi:HEAT repeat protein